MLLLEGKGIFGAGNVARILAAIATPFAQIGLVMEPREVNGQPDAISRDRDGKVVNTWALDILDGRIRAIRTVINPGKLGHAGPVADAWTVLREANRARRMTAGADMQNRPGVSAD
jgi:RNA polymerase sigma-70 factor (ECF subfamily)